MAADMKTPVTALLLTLATAFSLSGAETPAGKAFVEKYKTAYEANDKKTLESFLYTEGANPMALEFFKMMVTEGAGGKISKIELLDLSAEEQKKAEGIREGPGGQKTRMPLKPTRKLQITLDTKSAESTGTSTSTALVAEKDGKMVIPVPATAK